MTKLAKRIRLVTLVTATLPFSVTCNGAKTEGSAQGKPVQASQNPSPKGGAEGQADAAATDAVCADELTDALDALEQNSNCDTVDDCELVSTLSWQLSEQSIGMDNGQVLLNKDAAQQDVTEAAAVLSACGGDLGPSDIGWEGTVVCEDKHCAAARDTSE